MVLGRANGPVECGGETKRAPRPKIILATSDSNGKFMIPARVLAPFPHRYLETRRQCSIFRDL